MLCSVTMIGDKQLIRQYAAQRSEPAFAELVRRHLKMVYGAALRQVHGDAHLAEDVAQSVFSDLARKAGKLQHNHSIAGWLHASTRFAAANAVRAETRRRTREQAVVSMNEMNSNANASWNELRPMIDEALEELGGADREAIVLRYFEAYEFSLVGAALGVSENAARMRVDRALEKLRAILQKRGMATTGAALAGALAESSATAVPAQLAAGITSAALAQVGTTFVSSAPSILKIIAMKKLSLAAVSVLTLSVATVLVVRNLPESNPQKAAASPGATQASPGQPGGTAPSTGAQGDPDIQKKIVQRHDDQVRARQGPEADEARARWDKELAEFENSMKPETGVKKFGAARQISSIGPNETVIMGGWQTEAGRRMLVLITPSTVDSAGNKVAPPFNAQSQIQIDSKFVEVPETLLAQLGLQSLLTDQNESQEAVTCSDAQFRSYLNAMGQQSGSDILSSPRVTTSFGTQAKVSVQETQMIAGKNQALGPSLGLLPTLNEDGVSLDLDATALYSTAADGNSQ